MNGRKLLLFSAPEVKCEVRVQAKWDAGHGPWLGFL